MSNRNINFSCYQCGKQETRTFINPFTEEDLAADLFNDMVPDVDVLINQPNFDIACRLTYRAGCEVQCGTARVNKASILEVDVIPKD